MNKYSILVVEDEALIVANLVHTLSSLGYTVQKPVATGEDAIVAVTTRKPDLVLMDIVLSGAMNGIEAADKIRAIADIPIVYLTAYTDDKRLAKARLTEPYGYLVKPAHSRELHATIEMAMYKHGLDRKLKESEERYRSVVTQASEAIAIFDSETKHFIEVNSAFRRLFGYTEEEIPTLTLYEIMAYEPEEVNREFQKIVTERQCCLGELRCRCKNRSEIHVEVSASVIECGGKDAVVCAIAHDVTKRKRAEETTRHALAEKEVLLREIHHRVKNNLTGIISLIELQLSSLTDPAAISQLRDLETRIRSMALVHESLYLTKDLARINVASYTENLTRHLFQVYGTGTDIRCRIDMGDVTMPIETATPCGLVMSEIVTNSLKYAFPPSFSCVEIRGEPCMIALTLHREGNDYLLGVADNGIGMPEGSDVPRSHSLGMYLIRLIVEHQLRGSLEISFAGGTAYTIRFPEPIVKERNTYE